MKNMTKALVAAVAIALAGVAQARDFRSSDTHPADYPTVMGVKFMSERLKELSGGKMGIKVFPDSKLGQEKDTIEQIKIGGLDMIRVNVAPLNNIVPETLALAMPFVFRSKDHMRKVLDGAIGDDILKAMEAQGFIGLAYYDSGARNFYTAAKPIKSMADMKGMKLRVQQSDLFVAMVEALGANATPMPYGEVFTALKTHLIDGAENNWPSYESSSHFEAAKNYSLTEHSMAPEVVVFSKKIWDTLTPDDQKLIRQAAKESIAEMRKLWDERETKARAKVEAAGTQVFKVEDREKMVEAMKPVYDKFAADPKIKDLVKRIQDTK
ncbi:MAG: TRAP transporter substrate-binding protein [Candidatus Competibacteraceae bacterium]|nr:TRAP transporter substrate-binding protein [Candidatus Competibacteraceae bacterium]MBK8898956.1 TRAP transporter substrate-binding protein [Candidatus Competibacteraceae bacterium]MBK9951961.1 TRAP transporter substrate-binding protein [Candidatus Competibacteraceae bacterium]